MPFFWNISLFLAAALLAFYAWMSNKFKYWSRKGMVGPKPTFLFGNIKDMVVRKKHMGETFQDLYTKYKNHPYIGVYMMMRPTLLVNDLDLIRRMLTKDFVHFSGHGFHFDPEAEPIADHLFNADGAKWKYLRAKLTPTFTSSKMKMMFNIVNDCSRQLSKHLEGYRTEDVDVKEALATFGNDVIANCAFGIECNTFENPNEKFRKMGKRIFNPTVGEQIVNTIDFFFPNLISKYKHLLLNNDIERFFYGVVEETVNYRERNGIVRNDFMQLLIELKNTGSVADDDSDKTEEVLDDGTRLTMMQLAAQAFLFFIAGFETSSSAASFALYELALNPDVQEKVTEEIDRILEKHNRIVTYDSLLEMPYLTRVMEETMRKYPALPVHFRSCTKDYVMPDTNIKIEKGTQVLMPIYAIHKDPEIFPDPERFDPDRFTPENKSARHHFSYLPFGEGPRICIGNRFGIMQTKLGLVAFLSKYNVFVCDKTPIPMEYDKKNFVLTSDGGLWLKIKPRQNSNIK